MPLITLTTDLGLSDYYVASVKGAILNMLPDAQIVDITHLIPKYDIMKAAFNLKCAYNSFPKGSIHIASVNSIETEAYGHIFFEYEGHYFIGADNGLLSIVVDNQPVTVYQLNKQENNLVSTFPTREIFIKAAAHIAKGGKPEKIAFKIDGMRKALLPAAAANSEFIRGNVLYIDDYGNLITNISKEIFKAVGTNKKFTVYMRNRNQGLRKIYMQYEEVAEGDAIVFFNSLDLLEIAINKGSAAKLMGMKPNENIRIDFE
jgi:S-adenosylmethionine hydrolase